jgi:TadE-like protein
LRQRTGSGSCRRERGASAVEMAIILPLLLALAFGIIDFGFVMNDWISVRQGGREGLRQAIVDSSPLPPNGVSWGCPIVAPSLPAPGSDAESIVCYTKARVGLDPTKTRVKILFNPPYQNGQPVLICVQHATSSVTGAYLKVLSGKVLSTKVESLIEQDEPTFTAPFSETPLTAWPASCNTL